MKELIELLNQYGIKFMIADMCLISKEFRYMKVQGQYIVTRHHEVVLSTTNVELFKAQLQLCKLTEESLNKETTDGRDNKRK